MESFRTPAKAPKRSHDSTPDGLVSACKKRPLIIPPSPFLTRLGYGSGVNVYLMERTGTPNSKLVKSPWAVKKINSRIKNASTGTFEERLKYEAKVLKNIKHENIVGYRGTVRGEDGTFCLCMESGEKSLNHLLENRQEEDLGPFEPEDIHKVALAVATALRHLHNKEKILHGDLKSHNVLVKGDFNEVKLCDFGVCMKLKEDLSGPANYDACYIGTAAWSSLEALEEGVITDRADIYSFGCVLFEMLALNVPHMPPLDLDDTDEDSLLDKEDSFDEMAFMEAQGSVPVLPNREYEDGYYPYIALMSACCDPNPGKRPSADELVKILQDMK